MVPETAPVSAPRLDRSIQVAKTEVEILPCPRNLAEVQPEHWVHISRSMGLTGMTESLATNLSLEQVSGSGIALHYTKEQHTMLNEVQRERICAALADYFGNPVQVDFIQAPQQQETPAQYMNRKREERHAEAVESIRNDATVQLLQQQFDAQIELSSVLPVD